MTNKSEAQQKLEDVMADIHTSTDSKEDKNKKFFAAAVDWFNEDIAGDITTADGRTLIVKKIPTL